MMIVAIAHTTSRHTTTATTTTGTITAVIVASVIVPVGMVTIAVVVLVVLATIVLSVAMATVGMVTGSVLEALVVTVCDSALATVDSDWEFITIHYLLYTSFTTILGMHGSASLCRDGQKTKWRLHASIRVAR